jgi:hypothetical protein
MTYFVFFAVITIMTLSVTVFKRGNSQVTSQHDTRANLRKYQDYRDRYPVVDAEELEPIDNIKRAKLKSQKQRYNKDAPFYSEVGPDDGEVAFRPEWQFNFPALPVAQSDAVVIGKVLAAQAHRSQNKKNIFTNLDFQVDEVLKGRNLNAGSVITVQRIGGFVKYADGRTVLFRLSGNGMPATGLRYALFLNSIDEDFTLLTGYELGTDGVEPLDNSPQFGALSGQNEVNFMQRLRDAVSQTIPQRQ